MLDMNDSNRTAEDKSQLSTRTRDGQAVFQALEEPGIEIMNRSI